MPPSTSSLASAANDLTRNNQPGTRSGQKPDKVPALDPGALTRFIALYEKHYGIRLDPGEASVKARRLLSFFRLIAAHADRASALNPGPNGPALNHSQGVLDSPEDDGPIHTAPDQSADAPTRPEHPNTSQPRQPLF